MDKPRVLQFNIHCQMVSRVDSSISIETSGHMQSHLACNASEGMSSGRKNRLPWFVHGGGYNGHEMEIYIMGVKELKLS